MRHRGPATFCYLFVALIGVQIIAAQTNTPSSPPDALAAVRPCIEERLPHATTVEIDRLIAEGRLLGSGLVEPDTPPRLRLAPLFRDSVRQDIVSLDPTFAVEVLFLVPAPELARHVDVELVTVLQSISTMEGIEYYSESRGRMRTLFHESHLIRDPEQPARLPDPTATALPDGETLYAYQRDSSFGRNVLELTYVATVEGVRLRMRNLTRMLYRGVLPAVGPESLEIDLVVVPVQGHVLFYGVAAARAAPLFGLEDRVERSFTNRLEALYRWFLGRVS